VQQGKLADLAAQRGAWDQAETLNRAALAEYRALGARWEEAVRSYSFARMQYQRGKLDEAVALMARVVDIETQLNYPDLAADRQRLEQWQRELSGEAPEIEDAMRAANEQLMSIYEHDGEEAVRDQMRALGISDELIEDVLDQIRQQILGSAQPGEASPDDDESAGDGES